MLERPQRAIISRPTTLTLTVTVRIASPMIAQEVIRANLHGLATIKTLPAFLTPTCAFRACTMPATVLGAFEFLDGAIVPSPAFMASTFRGVRVAVPVSGAVTWAPARTIGTWIVTVGTAVLVCPSIVTNAVCELVCAMAMPNALRVGFAGWPNAG